MPVDASLLQQVTTSQTDVQLIAAYNSICSFLKPLLDIEDASSSCKKPDLDVLSRKFGHFLVNYLKASFAKLADNGLVTLVVQHFDLGLRGLEVLRSTLKGKQDELEIQRYNLVCKLVSLQQHASAAEQGRRLCSCICRSWGTQSVRKGSAQHIQHAGNQQDLLPQPRKDEPKERVALVVSLAANLMHSIVSNCGAACSTDAPGDLVPVMAGVTPWLR